jgi:hypothetical protein
MMAKASGLPDTWQEAKAKQDLALEFVDVGYKILAKKLHPDAGGTVESMSRLGKARDTLLMAIYKHPL